MPKSKTKSAARREARRAKKAFRAATLDAHKILCDTKPLHKRPVLDLISK
jgi:hypothetical protein